MNNIVVFGSTGQVAWELQRSLLPLGDVVFLGRDQVDFTSLGSIENAINRYNPDIIVNAVAYTQVDKAESEIDLCYQINSIAVEYIAVLAKKIDALLIHYSTDYVYEGTGDNSRDESHPTAPINVYGQSKLDGEEKIIAQQGRYIIFRTSWVYGFCGHNFIKTIMRLAAEKESLSIISDQIGSPTGAELISDVTAHVIKAIRDTNTADGAVKTTIQEVYHLVASGDTSWHEYARFIIDILRKKNYPVVVKNIDKTITSHYPTPAKRPLNSRLSVNKIEQDFGLKMPHWQLGVQRVIEELIKEK